VDLDVVVRTACSRAELTLRELAERAGTSHATLAAYESGRTVPGVRTVARIVRAAGFDLSVDLLPRVDAHARQPRGDELREVLELAEQFPARHQPTLTYPRFGA
jgi:transcriptional regulator with XRE-family HTH domain